MKNEIKQRLKHEYNTLKKRGNYIIFDAESKIHDALNDLGKFDKSRREPFIIQAKNELKAQLSDERRRAGATHKTVITSWMNDLDETLKNKPKMEKDFHSKVKRLILSDFLKGCIEKGLRVEEIV